MDMAVTRGKCAGVGLPAACRRVRSSVRAVTVPVLVSILRCRSLRFNHPSRCGVLTPYGFDLHFLRTNIDRLFMSLLAVCIISWCVTVRVCCTFLKIGLSLLVGERDVPW